MGIITCDTWSQWIDHGCNYYDNVHQSLVVITINYRQNSGQLKPWAYHLLINSPRWDSLAPEDVGLRGLCAMLRHFASQARWLESCDRLCAGGDHARASEGSCGLVHTTDYMNSLFIIYLDGSITTCLADWGWFLATLARSSNDLSFRNSGNDLRTREIYTGRNRYGGGCTSKAWWRALNTEWETSNIHWWTRQDEHHWKYERVPL